jgi:hypothetical protein
MPYIIILELAVGNIVRRVLRLIRDVYNSEASHMTSSTAEEVEDEVDEEEDDKVKSLPQKGRTDLQSYGGSSFITGSSFFSSSASMINLLGDGSPVGTSLDYEKKSYHILLMYYLLYKHYKNYEILTLSFYHIYI